MNTSTFITALVIAAVFLLFKFLEMRFILKENKPLKNLLKETLVVYFLLLYLKCIPCKSFHIRVYFFDVPMV